MSVVIFGDIFSFPEGNAATNRVHTYAKGFSEMGLQVHVIQFANDYNSLGDGIYNGIAYYQPFGTEKPSSSFVKRQLRKIAKSFKTVQLIRQINRSDQIQFINVCTNVFSTHFFSWFLAKASGAKLIIELNEHPLRHFQSGWLKRSLGLAKLRAELYFCDGVFCISNYLIGFLKSKNFTEQKMLLVPSTVDPARFRITDQNPLDQPYIGYFGGLTFERDSVDLLLKAFAKASKKHNDLKLCLAGFGSDGDLDKIKNLIKELNIQNDTILLGYLEREEVIKYMMNAKILVMVRSNNLEAQASFPSKLPEFLACAKPVIAVNVGEISSYVTNDTNIFLVEPDNADALSDKIDFILTKYNLAEAVGRKGKKLANTIFNYNYQAKRMLEFVDKLK